MKPQTYLIHVLMHDLNINLFSKRFFYTLNIFDHIIFLKQYDWNVKMYLENTVSNNLLNLQN